MAKFIPYDYNQNAMVVVNFQDQIQPGTFEYALHYLIEQKLDLSVFEPAYNNDEGGRPAYDPAILLKIILFAYSKGITSSRQIEWCCHSNILFKALSCDTVPHFTTIASFVSGFPGQIEAVFEQVLLVCHQQGLLGNELFAIDGCKLPSNAAKQWSGTFKELEAKRKKLKKLIRNHLQRHRELDARDAGEAEQQLRTAQTIATLSAAADKIGEFLKKSEPRMGRAKKPQEVKSNITDNDSAKMTTSKGTIQGYNGIAAVDGKYQIVVSARAIGEGQEQHCLRPVLEGIQERFTRLCIEPHILQSGVVITADTGYASEGNMAFLKCNGINAYIPDHQFRSRDPKFGNVKAKYANRAAITGNKATKRLYRETFTASDFAFDADAMTCQCPQGEQLSYYGTYTNSQGDEVAHFAGRVLQCRHCPLKEQCLRSPTGAAAGKSSGRRVSFVVKKRGEAGRSNAKPNTAWMKSRIDTEAGRAIYGRRMSVVEPVFANIAINKRLRRFSLRSQKKVNGQWQLFCLVHNIEKLQNFGSLGR
jgi:transposase